MALNSAVYLWSAATGETELLMQCTGSDDYVTSVRWASDGNHVAVGTSNADVQLWDANRIKQVWPPLFLPLHRVSAGSAVQWTAAMSNAAHSILSW